MTETTDVLIIGGGVFGLCAARACSAAGLRVILCEGEFIGATHMGAASSGLVGALTPHRPEKWRALKDFQLQALIGLPNWMEELQAETGTDPGYRRCGRLSPLTDTEQRVRAEAQVQGAVEHWGGAGQFSVLDDLPEEARGWLEPGLCTYGVVHETLSAQVAPRRYLEALADWLDPRIDLREGWFCVAIDPETGVARFPEGEIAAGHVVIAAGTRSFNLIELLTGRRLGSGVKGQAAMLQGKPPSDMDNDNRPIIQGSGVYIVPHDEGRVAVGSTSERNWDALECDAQLDALIERARATCPALAEAEVTERWAGLRPHANGTTPMVGPMPENKQVIVATGGFKIGLAIAHQVAQVVCAAVQEVASPVDVPDEFDPVQHLGPAPSKPMSGLATFDG